MTTYFEVRSKFSRFVSLFAAERTLRKLELLQRAINHTYDPNWPRVPRGNPDGGEWTDRGGRTRIAQNVPPGGRLPLIRSVTINGRQVELTPGQAARIDAAALRTNAALQRVREIDHNWRPTPGLINATPEEAVRRSEDIARQTENRLTELGRLPPDRLMSAYRARYSQTDMFGRESWPRGEGTVSVCTINDRPVFGVNSGSPAYTSIDRATAERARDALIERYPQVMLPASIGRRPNDALFHAEATALFRASRYNNGSLAGVRIEMFVDRPMCWSCRRALPSLGLELGNPTATFVGPQSFGSIERWTLRSRQVGMWARPPPAWTRARMARAS